MSRSRDILIINDVLVVHLALIKKKLYYLSEDGNLLCEYILQNYISALSENDIVHNWPKSL